MRAFSVGFAGTTAVVVAMLLSGCAGTAEGAGTSPSSAPKPTTNATEKLCDRLEDWHETYVSFVSSVYSGSTPSDVLSYDVDSKAMWLSVANSDLIDAQSILEPGEAVDDPRAVVRDVNEFVLENCLTFAGETVFDYGDASPTEAEAEGESAQPVGDVTVTNGEGYVYRYSFDTLTVDATTSIENTAPGRADVTVAFSVDGSISNDTEGRALGGKVSPPALYLALPAGSVLCSQTKMGSTGSVGQPLEFDPTPTGKACVLALALATPTALPAAGTSAPLSDTSGSITVEVVEADAAKIAEEAAAGKLVVAFAANQLSEAQKVSSVACDATLPTMDQTGFVPSKIVLTGGSASCG